MRRSIRRFLTEPCRHVIAVPSQDIAAFKRAFRDDPAVDITCQQDVVDRCFYPDLLYHAISRLAPSQKWRLKHHAGSPGWIVQQIVKLSCTNWVSDGAVIFVDSDLIFTRPFALADLGVKAHERVLVRITPAAEASRHRKHLDHSRRILYLPAGSSDHHYMGYPAIWYTDWVTALQHHLEKNSRDGWQRALHRAQHISEYTLYGLFVEEVLRPSSLVIQSTPFHRIVFDHDSFQQLRREAQAGYLKGQSQLTLVVQSNLGIDVNEYEEILASIIDPSPTTLAWAPS
jgi:hypothetical protein